VYQISSVIVTNTAATANSLIRRCVLKETVFPRGQALEQKRGFPQLLNDDSDASADLQRQLDMAFHVPAVSMATGTEHVCAGQTGVICHLVLCCSVSCRS